MVHGLRAAPEAGLHEKMTWFWHGHFASSLAQGELPALVDQKLVPRRHALGNCRQLA